MSDAGGHAIVDWIAARLSERCVEDFLTRFGGQRVPKKPLWIVHRQRVRIVTAVALRVSATRGVLCRKDAEDVARETFASYDTVRTVWFAWRRQGVRAFESGQSTADATALENLRW